MRVIIVLISILLSSISIIYIHNHILINICIIPKISRRRIHHRLRLNILLIRYIINWLYRRRRWRVIRWWWYYFIRYILLNCIAMIIIMIMIINIIILLNYICLYLATVRYTLQLLLPLSRWGGRGGGGRGQYLWHILINPLFIDVEKWSWKKELSLLKYKACFL